MPRLATIEQTAHYLGRSPRTVRNYIGKGFFPAYKRPGSRGLFIDLEEVDRAMQALPARKAHAASGSYGPKARIVTLPHRAEVVSGDDS